jgi:catechol 2,3-dioxygenase-like lactoylglutathione lyase family enzyme
VSEYQYYEFLAVDRPLTEPEMRELRAVSSRAVITPTRFTNHYEWGDFKGDPRAWMERYFDAFLYFANWGTHELMLRLPRRVLEPATARRYCRGDAASARAKGGHVILEFLSEAEGSDWYEEEDEDGNLSALVPLRADLAAGDLRALYLGWLLCVQAGELDDGEAEPPCPPGLGRLSAAVPARRP